MKLDQLSFNKRGDLLELAEIMGIVPNNELEPYQEFQAVAMRVLPNSPVKIDDWWSIIQKIKDNKDDEELKITADHPERWLVTVLEPSADNNIIIVHGCLPFDSHGNAVQFKGKPHTWYVIDIYQYYQDYLNGQPKQSSSPS